MRDGNDDLREAGIQVVGISTDKWETQARFADSHRLSFILLGDPEAEAVEAYGARGFLGLADRRSFLVGKGGEILAIWESPKTSKHAEEVLEGAREVGITRQP